MNLSYWAIKGIAESIRLSFAALDVSYTETNPSSEDDWAKTKAELLKKHPFVNIPFISNGDDFVSESRALPTYIAENTGNPDFVGKKADKVRYEQILGVLVELASVWRDVAFKKGCYKKKLKANKERVWRLTGQLNTYLVQNRREKYILGYLTYLDAKAFYVFYLLGNMYKNVQKVCIFKDHAALKNIVGHFGNIPQVKTYLQSDTFKRVLDPPKYVQAPLDIFESK